MLQRFSALVVTVTLLCACAGRITARHDATNGLSAADLERGRAVFAAQCAACHGAGGVGGQIGPALTGERKRRTHHFIAQTIFDPDPPMPKLYPSVISARELRDVTSYVESL